MKNFLNVIKLLSGLLILHQHANAYNCSIDKSHTVLSCRYNYLTFNSGPESRKIINYALESGIKNARLYYQSTGTSSGYSGTVFPFYGISEWNNKSFDKNDLREAKTILNDKFIGEISDERDRRNFILSLNAYASRAFEEKEANYITLILEDKKFAELITRLGSLEDARFSYEFNSSLWDNDYSTYDESSINVLIDALKEIFDKEKRVVGIFENNEGTYDMEGVPAEELNRILYGFTS